MHQNKECSTLALGPPPRSQPCRWLGDSVCAAGGGGGGRGGARGQGGSRIQLAGSETRDRNSWQNQEAGYFTAQRLLASSAREQAGSTRDMVMWLSNDRKQESGAHTIRRTTGPRKECCASPVHPLQQPSRRYTVARFPTLQEVFARALARRLARMSGWGGWGAERGTAGPRVQRVPLQPMSRQREQQSSR